MPARYHKAKRMVVESPGEVEAFLKAIEAVCFAHRMSISHEDHQGAFIIERYSDKNINWLNHAFIGKSFADPLLSQINEKD